jgi:hypothetical protein
VPRRFFLRALVALLIYCCVVGAFYWSPWISGKIRPYLYAALTESIDFVKVRAVVTDLFSYSPAKTFLLLPPMGFARMRQ